MLFSHAGDLGSTDFRAFVFRVGSQDRHTVTSWPHRATSSCCDSEKNTFLWRPCLLNPELCPGLARGTSLRYRAENPAFSALSPGFQLSFAQKKTPAKPFLQRIHLLRALKLGVRVCSVLFTDSGQFLQEMPKDSETGARKGWGRTGPRWGPCGRELGCGHGGWAPRGPEPRKRPLYQI